MGSRQRCEVVDRTHSDDDGKAWWYMLEAMQRLQNHTEWLAMTKAE